MSLSPSRCSGLVGLSLLICLLAACSSAPVRTPPQRLAELERSAADGRFDSAWQTAEFLQDHNDPRAVQWYERAAAITPWTFHNAVAEERLGRIWLNGLTADAWPGQTPTPPSALRPSWRKAERWFKVSAAHGNPYAMSALAQQYQLRGQMALSLRWDMRMLVYRRFATRTVFDREQLAPQDGRLHPLVADIQRRAQRGDAAAQVDLGTLYERGYGVAQDAAQALQWYERAGAQGDAHGQYLAGLLLGRGRAGVDKDLQRAAMWFAKAEQQHFYLAQPSYWQDAVKPPVFNFSE